MSKTNLERSSDKRTEQYLNSRTVSKNSNTIWSKPREDSRTSNPNIISWKKTSKLNQSSNKNLSNPYNPKNVS